ncbi:SixA phosphatase family protein [Sinisalibacter aestuarii]|uniref:Phosphoglycerate mutase n=1 Tax=Sinisalibacter aestuarii TaxID=2949426 RepID=A0ABQ5LXQ5_9RHOB|nr:histidine phosphatase family protein [Sinisalibacter aestuarii]GKY89185.1 phosphoglycerate mutase [Sinisalibacter aestuarii]
MTLRLILTRHAKSDWADPLMDDHDRPLNKRGRKSATAIGAWLAARGVVPDIAFVSSAERTRETWARIARGFDKRVPTAFRDDLYHAEPDAMINALRGASGGTVMMVGHNPGAAFFARALLAQPPADARFDRYPTGATAVMEFEIDEWPALTWGTGVLTGLVFARDLV